MVHDRWKSGRINVVVATTAFGMGIDKVCAHFCIPLLLDVQLNSAHPHSVRVSVMMLIIGKINSMIFTGVNFAPKYAALLPERCTMGDSSYNAKIVRRLLPGIVCDNAI